MNFTKKLKIFLTDQSAEIFGLMLAGALFVCLVAKFQGGLGLSFDSFNHHFYLGYNASHSRIGQDFMAASFQGYQSPYIYWPLFQLYSHNVEGVKAAIILGFLQLMWIPALWLIAKEVFPQATQLHKSSRIASVLLGGICPIVLVHFFTTFGDLLAITPAVYAIACATIACRYPAARIGWMLMAASGFLIGISAGLKLSSAYVLLACTVLWFGAWVGVSMLARAYAVMLAGVFTVIGFVAVYGAWGLQLQVEFGNPVFPLFNGVFRSPDAPQLWSGVDQRFVPQTIWEALAKPFLMMDPTGMIYTEISSPDARFFCISVLLIWAGLKCMRSEKEISWPQPLKLLTGYFLIAFALWQFRSGNGRYMLPLALLVGPLIVGVAVYSFSNSRVRNFILLAVFGMQSVSVLAGADLNAWNMGVWSKSPPQFSLDGKTYNNKATFITLTPISYSMVISQFHPQSKWINLVGQQIIPVDGPGYMRVMKILESSKKIIVVFPASGVLTDRGSERLNKTAGRILKSHLNDYGLQVLELEKCELKSLSGISTPNFKAGLTKSQEIGAKFWFCPADWAVEYKRINSAEDNSRIVVSSEVFKKLEAMCPRVFSPSNVPTQRANSDENSDAYWLVRRYFQSDVRTYITNDGFVSYKYFRGLNGVNLGKIENVLSDKFKLDCLNLPGRYRFPWDRDI